MDKETLSIALQALTLLTVLGGGYRAFIVLQLGQQQTREDLDQHTKAEEQFNRDVRDRLTTHGERITRLEAQKQR